MLNDKLSAFPTANKGDSEELLLKSPSLTPQDLAKFDEKTLWKMLHHVNWNRMDAASRLAVYQEFENRQARLDGRKPVQIRADMPMKPNLYGIHRTNADGSEIIFINPRFVKTSKLFGNTDTSIFNAASGLDTVMHEGRHAFQHHVVKNKLDVVSELQRMEWAASMVQHGGTYIPNTIFYAIQGIEMDARRFGRRQMEKINSYFKSIGHEDPNFTNAIADSLATEKDYIAYIRANLTLADIDKVEQHIMDHFRKTHPDLKLDKLSIFYHARLILLYPEITDPKEMLDLIEKYLDGKLGQLNAKLDDLDKGTLGGVKDNHLNGPRDRIKG